MKTPFSHTPLTHSELEYVTQVTRMSLVSLNLYSSLRLSREYYPSNIKPSHLACYHRYDANVLSDYLKSLAVVLHQEIVNTDEDDVVRATLDAMHAIARVVSESSSKVRSSSAKIFYSNVNSEHQLEN